jgi:WD40 repeat protein
MSSTPTPPVTEFDFPAKPSPLVHRVFGEPRFHTESDIAAVRFAPDGTLYSIDESGILQHWSPDGRMLARHYLSDLETLWCFNPTATVLASGNDDLLFWDVKSGTLLNRVGRASWVTAVGFAADGGLVASGHDDGKVRLWETAKHTLVAEIAAHPKPVSAVAFSPDGTHLATAGEDRAVRVWDRKTGAKVGEFLSHTDRIPALAWSGDGALLISAGWDTSARVWKLGQPDPLMLLNSHSDQVVALAHGPAGTLATADSDNEIHVWTDAVTAKTGPVLRGHVDEIRCIAFNADGSRLASAGADRVVHVWDTKTGQLLAGPNPKAKHFLAVVPSIDGKLKLASTGAPTFRLWDADTGAELPPTGDGPAYSVAASADGKYLAVGGTDHFTRLYDLSNPAAAPKKLEATKPPIGCLSFSTDGGTLAQTSPADGLVWLWNTLTGEPRIILIDAADNCTLESVVAHPDGERVVVGGIDYLSTENRTGAVCVWHVAKKERELVFDVGVYAVAVDPPGRYLAGAGMNDAVYVWDTQTQEMVFELAGHQERINCVAFSPDGSYLLSGGDDMTVRVWDVLSGRLLMVREFDSAVQSLAFSPDGRWLFTGNGNTTCYQLDFEKLLED